jgi:hypothetical protein
VSGIYLNALTVLVAMADQVGLDDACVECGYQFAYDQEGCDACRTITDVLQRANLTRSYET